MLHDNDIDAEALQKLHFVFVRQKHLWRALGRKDRQTVGDYLESVREIERRIQVAEKEQQTDLALPDAPVGIPFSFEEHITLMYDLLALAFEALLEEHGMVVAGRNSPAVRRRLNH